MASIYDLLKADHARAVRLLGDLQNGLSSSEAELSLSRLKEGLKLHTEFENVVFYPTLRAAPGAGQPLNELVHDHTRIQKLLSELSELDVSFPEWQDIIDELMPLVEGYAIKEETILIAVFDDVIDVLEIVSAPGAEDADQHLVPSESDRAICLAELRLRRIASFGLLSHEALAHNLNESGIGLCPLRHPEGPDYGWRRWCRDGAFRFRAGADECRDSPTLPCASSMNSSAATAPLSETSAASPEAGASRSRLPRRTDRRRVRLRPPQAGSWNSQNLRRGRVRGGWSRCPAPAHRQLRWRPAGPA